MLSPECFYIKALHDACAYTHYKRRSTIVPVELLFIFISFRLIIFPDTNSLFADSQAVKCGGHTTLTITARILNAQHGMERNTVELIDVCEPNSTLGGSSVITFTEVTLSR